jgi:hypothetical protein
VKKLKITELGLFGGGSMFKPSFLPGEVIIKCLSPPFFLGNAGRCLQDFQQDASPFYAMLKPGGETKRIKSRL